MTYSEFKNLKAKLNKDVNKLSDELNSYERNDYGLATKETKKLKGYQSCKMLYKIKFKQLQEINKIGMRLFKNEIRNEKRTHI
jgi:hypothetical protein